MLTPITRERKTGGLTPALAGSMPFLAHLHAEIRPQKGTVSPPVRVEKAQSEWRQSAVASSVQQATLIPSRPLIPRPKNEVQLQPSYNQGYLATSQNQSLQSRSKATQTTETKAIPQPIIFSSFARGAHEFRTNATPQIPLEKNLAANLGQQSFLRVSSPENVLEVFNSAELRTSLPTPMVPQAVQAIASTMTPSPETIVFLHAASTNLAPTQIATKPQSGAEVPNAVNHYDNPVLSAAANSPGTDLTAGPIAVQPQSGAEISRAVKPLDNPILSTTANSPGTDLTAGPIAVQPQSGAEISSAVKPLDNLILSTAATPPTDLLTNLRIQTLAVQTFDVSPVDRAVTVKPTFSLPFDNAPATIGNNEVTLTSPYVEPENGEGESAIIPEEGENQSEPGNASLSSTALEPEAESFEGIFTEAETQPGESSSEPAAPRSNETGSEAAAQRGSQGSVKLDSPQGGATRSAGLPLFVIARKSRQATTRAVRTGISKPQAAPHQNPGKVSTRPPRSAALPQESLEGLRPARQWLQSQKVETNAALRPSTPEHLEKLQQILEVKDLAQQLQARARLGAGENTSLEIRLKPPHLGMVRVQIEMLGEEMRMVLVTDRPEAVGALKEAAPELSRLVADQGYTLTQCDIQSGSPQQHRWPEGYETSQTASRRQALHQADREGEAERALEEGTAEHHALDFGYNSLDLVA